MAHVVGVPKRDPCRKCELPVFLAERLMVGKKVYHRTCLKCARCGYQLTPGSFYETEIDEQYCCETCPDEELNQNNIEQDIIRHKVTEEANCLNSDLENISKKDTTKNVLTSPTKSVRSSIRDRLAFFENQRDDGDSGKQLLQKSLSDEEKSKSLQRIESAVGTVEVSYKPKISVSNFLLNAVDSEEPTSEASVSIKKSEGESSDSEDDTDTSVSLPPELPKSLPPSTELNIEKKPEERKRFSVSAQLELSSSTLATTPDNPDQHNNFVIEPVNKNESSELKVNLSTETGSTTNNVNDDEQADISAFKSAHSEEQKTEKQSVELNPIKLEDKLEFSDNDCVTKDKYADENTIKTSSAENLQQIMCEKDQVNIDVNQPEEIQNIGDNETIEENSVELRTTGEEISNISLHLENAETTERHGVTHSHLQQYEVIRNNEDKEKVEELPSEQTEKNVIECEVVTNTTNIESKLIKNEIETETDEKITLFKENELETEIVPSTNRAKDNEILECNLGDKNENFETTCSKENTDNVRRSQIDNKKTSLDDYPDDLNPFKSDDEEVIENNKENVERSKLNTTSSKKENSNPFDSSDDEVELEKAQKSETSTISTPKVPPPRPPPPRISKNPFGSEDEDETSTQKFTRRSSLTGSQNRKTPVPTPRSNISQSQNPTPEATPRLSTKVNATISYAESTTPNNSSLPILQNSSEFYGSANSLYSNILRNSDVRSSNTSLNLSAGGTIRSRKSRRAPLPPAPVRELFPSSETLNTSSKTSTPSSSTVGTPKSARKKRPAPAPPKPARHVPQVHGSAASAQPKNLDNYPLQSGLNSKLSDEEKALLEGKTLKSLHEESDLSPSSRRCSKRLIPLDKELIEEHGSLQYVEKSNSQCDDLKQQNQHKSLTVHEEEPNVVYRRVLVPLNLETPTHEHNPLIEDLSKSPSLGGRQMEKLKDNKEAHNRNRQSQISVTSSGADDNDPLFNKSAHGKWKRRKGPAPALPIPPRKVLQMLPLQEIKHELEIIEVQQQGLEKQGVILEKMIRDRCEGENGEPLIASGLPGETTDSASGSSAAENSKEVENLILQLFELVNEKNELFRRQAELMYLRRQHRLEQEQADLEYEIRVLMAQPERNKTDSDKAREEALIERLVEVVQLRNEVIECLEMDRLREAEEDQSIKKRLESHIAKRDEESNPKKGLTKLSKKEKKKQKEAKKLSKSKKLDADKDADESEVNVDKPKKKKKLLIF